MRSEVLSPFRTVRMFFYLAFIASGTLGGLIATTQLIAALTNSSKAVEIPEILKGLGVDIGAVSLFAFLYSGDNNAKNAQLTRLSREESLSNLKLSVDQKRIITLSSLRGIARLVICAGPASFIVESFRLSEHFTESLLDRGVLVVPFAADGNLPSFEFEENEESKEITTKRKRLWQLAPFNVSEWSKWLDEQKKLAGVSSESPVYLSIFTDGWACPWQWRWLPSLERFCCTITSCKGYMVRSSGWHGWKSTLKKVSCLQRSEFIQGR